MPGTVLKVMFYANVGYFVPVGSNAKAHARMFRKSISCVKSENGIIQEMSTAPSDEKGHQQSNGMLCSYI